MSKIQEHEFQDGLCSVCDGGHCMSGCFCPCILVNKTQDLIEDPSDRNPNACGAWGIGWCALNMCGGWGMILGCLQRRQIRKKYGIEGGGCTDFMVSFCCPCCSAIQNVKELEARRDARPNKVGYQPQAPMRDPEQYAYLNGPRG